MYLKTKKINFFENVVNTVLFFIPFIIFRLFFALNNLTILTQILKPISSSLGL